MLKFYFLNIAPQNPQTSNGISPLSAKRICSPLHQHLINISVSFELLGTSLVILMSFKSNVTTIVVDQDTKDNESIFKYLKALDTLSNCQRPVISLGVSTHLCA